MHDWKSCVPPKGTVGSNPTLSAILIKKTLVYSVFFVSGGNAGKVRFCARGMPEARYIDAEKWRHKKC